MVLRKEQAHESPHHHSQLLQYCAARQHTTSASTSVPCPNPSLHNPCCAPQSLVHTLRWGDHASCTSLPQGFVLPPRGVQQALRLQLTGGGVVANLIVELLLVLRAVAPASNLGQGGAASGHACVVGPGLGVHGSAAKQRMGCGSGRESCSTGSPQSY